LSAIEIFGLWLNKLGVRINGFKIIGKHFGSFLGIFRRFVLPIDFVGNFTRIFLIGMDEGPESLWTVDD
jgi:hypothetical protein